MLLIVFMVTVKLIVGQNAMTVDLLKASTGDEVQEILSVVLRALLGLSVNGVSREKENDLLALAKHLAVKTPDLRALIKADGKVANACVMHALVQLRLAGISHVAYAVVPRKAMEPKPEGSTP